MVEWSRHCFSGFATVRQDSAVQSEDGRRDDAKARVPASSPFTIGLLLEEDGNNATADEGTQSCHTLHIDCRCHAPWRLFWRGHGPGRSAVAGDRSELHVRSVRLGEGEGTDRPGRRHLLDKARPQKRPVDLAGTEPPRHSSLRRLRPWHVDIRRGVLGQVLLPGEAGVYAPGRYPERVERAY